MLVFFLITQIGILLSENDFFLYIKKSIFNMKNDFLISELFFITKIGILDIKNSLLISENTSKIFIRCLRGKLATLFDIRKTEFFISGILFERFFYEALI